MGSDANKTPIPTSESAVFGYQAKLLARSGSGLAASEFGGQPLARPGHSMAGKRNSIDVGSVRGKWAQREAEERELFKELGVGAKNAVPRPGAGPMSPGASTSFSSISSRNGSLVSSRPMSPEEPSRASSSAQGDSLQRLLHRRAKSYVPAIKPLPTQPEHSTIRPIQRRVDEEPSVVVKRASDASASTSAYGSDRVISSSTVSTNPLLPDITGSSTSSSIIGPNGERRYKSSYMARKEAKKRDSMMSFVGEGLPIPSASVPVLSFKADPPAIAEEPKVDKEEDLATAIRDRLALDEAIGKQKESTELDREEHRNEALSKLMDTPKKATTALSKPSSPDEDLSPTVKAFRERIKNEGPLYKPDMSPSRSLRKRVSTSLLGEPYWPNPNPVAGSHRTPAWKPSDSNSLLDSPSSKRQSPLASSFQLDSVNEDEIRPPLRENRRNITPVNSKSAFKSSVVPPSVPSSVYGEARRPSTQAQTPGKRYGSIGKSDGRKLGKHLPRIASGDQFTEDWEEERAKSAHIKDSSVSAPSPLKLTEKFAPDVPAVSQVSSMPLERPPSVSSVRQKQRVFEETPPVTTAVDTPAPPASPRKSQFVTGRQEAPVTPKRILPDGRGMQGLVGKGFATPKASAGLINAGATLERSGSVAGVKGRLRLSRLPASSTSATMAPAPLPSKRLNMNWMDRQRKELIAYEYLCHVGEAQQWIEGCLDEELGYGVVEMEESMTDGVALAKLARKYEGDEVVRHIWEVSHWILANVLASDKGLTDPVL